MQKLAALIHLVFVLSNGKHYASAPETIVPVPQNIAIDSIGGTSGQYLPRNLTNPYPLYAAVINVKTQDPADQKNYYRWINEDWLPRKTPGIMGAACAGTGEKYCFQTCYQFFEDSDVHILSDAGINGDEVRYQPVVVSPYFWSGSHYINIKQLSLTEQAYAFWALYEQQTMRTGGILDPLPASLTGNIYNINDSTDAGLGYFECSDVASLKFIFTPFFVNGYITLANAGQYIGEGACYLTYAPAVTNPPPGWETAPQYIINIY